MNTPDPDGETPLHLAAKAGHLDLCKLLIGHGANALSRNKRNRTPGMQPRLDDEVKEYLQSEEVVAKGRRQHKQAGLWDDKMRATQTQNACGVGVL